MKKSIILFLLLSAVGLKKNYSQDIQEIYSAGPLVLPQAGNSQYIVAEGQPVKLGSGVSVTLLPGTHLQLGSTVSIQISSSPVVQPHLPIRRMIMIRIGSLAVTMMRMEILWVKPNLFLIIRVT